MKTYLATRIDHVGAEYSIQIRSPDESSAEYVCKMNGWRYDGELIAEIPADETTVQQVAEMCERRNKGVENDA